MPAPLSQRELDALRADADRFIAELDEEAYLHFAGLKDTYDLVPIYERHAELTKLETALASARRSTAAATRASSGEFACEGYLGNFVNAEQEKIAELEASLKATVDGEEIPYRNLRPAIANSEDRGRRERLERARNELTEEHLNPLYLRSTQVVHRETERLGARELHRALPRLPVSARRPRRAVPPFPRLDRASLGGRGQPLLPQPRRARARRDRALGRRARLARR